MKTIFLPSLRRPALLLCLLLTLLPFAGCSSDPTGRIFRYDLSSGIENLDPQFSDSADARLVLYNLYEGLLVQMPDGELLPGVAESYTVSPDGLTYTFHLRETAWSNGDPVTAHDFVFSFLRLFRDGSPHAAKFSMIRGSGLSGGEPFRLSQLGVRANGDRELVIELDEPEPGFPERLCDPAAAPCNERAFTDARGRYGLEQKLVCSNGPFSLESWTDARLMLRASSHYRSGTQPVAGGVNFYVGREGAAEFLDGKTDLALLTQEQQEGLSSSQAEIFPIQKTVWCIFFNQNDRVFSSPFVRQALARAIDHTLMGEQVPASYMTTSVFVPGAMRVMGSAYRPLSGMEESPLDFDTQQAMRLLDLGLGSLGLDQLPGNTTILVPEDARATLNIAELQQGWQKHIAAYINFETVTPADAQSRLRSGDYQMLLMPVTPADSNIATLLGAFASTSRQNYFGYRSPIYDDLLQSAGDQHTAGQAAQKYAQAETLLLSDAVLIPLYFETSYLAVASGVQDVLFFPFGDHIYFKYAQKDG